MNPMDMAGRNVLITGAAQGIGLAAARLLSELGASLTLVDTNAEALATVAATFPEGRVLAIAGSVTDRAFVADMVAQSAARFGGVLQAVGTEMMARGEAGEKDPGTIVNISSDAGRKGTMGQINYGAAKSGVLGLTMSAAREWGKYGIRVNSVAYSIVETDMTETVRSEKFRDRYLAGIPLGRFMSPEEAAYSIAFLLSPASVFITGQHLSVNGGSHITA